MTADVFFKKTVSFIVSALIVIAMLLVVSLFLHGMVWASDKALPWLIEAGQLSFAICGFVFLPLCVFRKTRPLAGFGFVVASYVFGTEVFAYSCVVAFAIWGYTGLICGLLLGGIGVVPTAVLASTVAAIRHRTEWGLVWDILLGVLLTFGTRFFGIYLSSQSSNLPQKSKEFRPDSRSIPESKS